MHPCVRATLDHQYKAQKKVIGLRMLHYLLPDETVKSFDFLHKQDNTLFRPRYFALIWNSQALVLKIWEAEDQRRRQIVQVDVSGFFTALIALDVSFSAWRCVVSKPALMSENREWYIKTGHMQAPPWFGRVSVRVPSSQR
ncbi:hypothetical protein PoB_002703600 [Plakobranchus ocellatus]|uniref:Uncharacterized protein n=1 Tax=Plakobranchus ocellatus TaxID=259542 RepID=A0AAV3ZX91_9GAST|nr:hypothetical protein PoB_002703600 [Plakobranchus ocellatus]